MATIDKHIYDQLKLTREPVNRQILTLMEKRLLDPTPFAADTGAGDAYVSVGELTYHNMSVGAYNRFCEVVASSSSTTAAIRRILRDIFGAPPMAAGLVCRKLFMSKQLAYAYTPEQMVKLLNACYNKGIGLTQPTTSTD